MSESKPAPPQISPYVFPVLLIGFGLWCGYDGWLTADAKMAEHQTFNRVACGVLLLWGAIDFFRTHKREQAYKLRQQAKAETGDAPETAEAADTSDTSGN